MADDTSGVDVLDRASCLELLRSATCGRIAVTIDGLPAVLPVNFAVLDGDIVIRTNDGAVFRALLAEPVVAFEVDRIHPGGFGWSVLIRGAAREVAEPAALRRVRALALRPWAGGARNRVVRISAEVMSGRSIRAA